MTEAFAIACNQKKSLPKDGARRTGLLLQWHISDGCNLRCKHCYQDRQAERTPSLDVLLSFLGQYYDLSDFLPNSADQGRRPHINLTGGEPFLNPHLFDLLETLSAGGKASYGILTNGTLINPDIAQPLKELRPAFVQVSIEGSRKTHDQIRGEGNYRKAIEGIAHLVSAGVSVYISFTAYRHNYKDFPDVVRQGRELGVSRIWADRLIPCGNGASLMDDLLDPEETLAFFRLMELSRKRKGPFLRDRKDVTMRRALQFLVGGEEPYHCEAGNTLITILPNGDVLPCRRMPIVVGNIFVQPLKEIYLNNPFLKSLRNKTVICQGCEQCIFNRLCGGGLHCLSYAIKGSPFYADPGCWFSKTQETGKNNQRETLYECRN